MRKYIFFLLIILTFILPSGCYGQTPGISASPGEQFKLAIGQSATIRGEDLKIEFLEVTGDSRCPRNVVCIWQGEVTCAVELSRGDSPPQRLALTQPGLTSASPGANFLEYKISFTVDPYPEAGKPIAQEDYRLNLVVLRN